MTNYDELIKALRDTHDRVRNNPELAWRVPPYQLSAAADAIEKLTSADVAPVVHAQWIEKYWTTEDDWGVFNHHTLTCSACAEEYQWSRGKTNYCPNCGAKMDGTIS